MQGTQNQTKTPKRSKMPFSSCRPKSANFNIRAPSRLRSNLCNLRGRSSSFRFSLKMTISNSLKKRLVIAKVIHRTIIKKKNKTTITTIKCKVSLTSQIMSFRFSTRRASSM